MPRLEDLEPVPRRTRPVLFIFDASASDASWEQQICKAREIYAAYEEQAKRSADFQIKTLSITYGRQTCFSSDELLDASEIPSSAGGLDLPCAMPNYNSVLAAFAKLNKEKTLQDVLGGGLPPFVYWFISGHVPFEKNSPVDPQQLKKLLTSSVFSHARFWFVNLDGFSAALHDYLPIDNLIRYSQGVFPIKSPATELVSDCKADEVLFYWGRSGSLRLPCNEISFYFLVETSGTVKNEKLFELNEAFEALINGLKKYGKTHGMNIKIGIIEYNSCCQCLTSGGVVPIDDYSFVPFDNGGLADLGAALRELKQMIRRVNLAYPSQCYMPVFTFFTYHYSTDDWEKAYTDLNDDWLFSMGQHIGVAMSDEAKKFLREFCVDVRLLGETPFERFADTVSMVPMDDILPQFYIYD